MNKIYKFVVFILLANANYFSLAYEIEGSKWIGAKADFYVGIAGTSGSGISWNSAFIQALNEWNAKTVFDFRLIQEYRDPCKQDSLNGVAFLTDMCGLEFSNKTLAVTVQRFENQLLGPPALIEADIYVNNSVQFDVYDGANLFQRPYPNRLDFRRAVLHELGHVIGLDHEETEPAIMQSKYGQIYRLQEDDILGVNKLYSGLSKCTIRALRLGVTVDELSSNDCTVQELTVGSTDDSFLDIFKFSLTSSTDFDFTITSNELESVIIVADSDLNYLSQDSDTTQGCDANLQTTLGPGDYFLIVNTFDSQIKTECGLAGSYRLSVGYSGDAPQQLGPSVSLSGRESNASFIGNITANDGSSYGNLFTPQDSLDVRATITIDPLHIGQEGFLVAAARIEEQIIFLNSEGNFINSASIPGLFLPFAQKELRSIEVIEIINDLVAADFNIKTVSVEFFVGYGLTDSPNEIYFNETPLNLTISPP